MGARKNGCQDRVVVHVGGQEQHAGLRALVQNVAACLNPGLVGQADIHEDHIRIGAQCFRNRLSGRAGLAHDPNPGIPP